jgi:hypothetical protein
MRMMGNPSCSLDSICVHGVGPDLLDKYCTTIKLDVAVGAQEPREARASLRKICCCNWRVSFRFVPFDVPYHAKATTPCLTQDNQNKDPEQVQAKSSAF